ncbi:anti-sigma factor [Neolewinella antarctica]|uniref:Anti-sigma K factor RskA C-terminal domain-containing protein n=1 Tax=Neolewinella antarctica TaxID=442734 RepID=A0ABX0X6C0_9BACT|nr:anti-sigma factor [Neolewinella antarctica]NJC24568.1 hypothetical protein [Neolewinella antarctica]
MDTNQYIASGVLELYVLDLLDTSAQREEVERYVAEYPEIKRELFEIETALEAYALANARPLPAALLVPLLVSIRDTMPPTVDPVEPPMATESAPTSPPTADASTALPWLPWVLAAVLALVAAYLYFNGKSQVGEIEQERSELESEFAVLQEECDETSTALQGSQELNQLLTNPATRNVILAGSDNAPGSQAIVFHNVERDQTKFRATNLPTPPTGRQYQLWAIGDDGPVSIAVLDENLDADVLLDVDFVATAGTFAITLEETGGKPTPDLSQLQVIGEI